MILDAVGGFTATVELHEPRQGLVNERMIGIATGEQIVSVGGEVEAARFAITFGELHEKLAAVFGAEAIDHGGNLAGPGSIAFGAFHQLLQMAAFRGELAERV